MNWPSYCGPARTYWCLDRRWRTWRSKHRTHALRKATVCNPAASLGRIRATARGRDWQTGSPYRSGTALYGPERLDIAFKNGVLFLVEGESDTLTLWFHGLPSAGIPGADHTKVLQAEHIDGLQEIYVVNEKDDGGATFVQGVKDRLGSLNFPGKVFEMQMPDGIKDPSDLHIHLNGDSKQFKEQFQVRVKAATPIHLQLGPRIDPNSPPPPKSCDKKSKKIPRLIAPYQPFPVEALPSPLNTFVTEAAAALGCDPAYIALPILAVAGSSIGNTRTIQLKHKWQEPAVIWTAVVGDSGTLKTPAQRYALRPVYEIQDSVSTTWRACQVNPGHLPTLVVSIITVKSGASAPCFLISFLATHRRCATATPKFEIIKETVPFENEPRHQNFVTKCQGQPNKSRRLFRSFATSRGLAASHMPGRRGHLMSSQTRLFQTAQCRRHKCEIGKTNMPALSKLTTGWKCS